MDCMHCGSNRILEVEGKCSDQCTSLYMDKRREGEYNDTPDQCLGSGDYVSATLCLECGKLQCEFPVPDPEWYTEMMEDEE